jgi:hypothetical protein
MPEDVGPDDVRPPDAEVGQTIGFMSSVAQGLRPAKFHEKPRKTQGIPGCSGWFFDPVGMGVPPAKLHEKPAEARGISRYARWFFDPVFRAA